MKKKKNILYKIFTALSICLLTLSCSVPSLPKDAAELTTKPGIFPDYMDVTIPANLCPTNFMLTDCEEIVARLSFGDLDFVYGEGNKVVIDEDDWHELCSAAAGKKKGIAVDVYGLKDGKWLHYKPFHIYVAKEAIDPYIAFRSIHPSYMNFNELSIVQRNITDFEESDIYSNTMMHQNDKGQCINCHSFQNNDGERMLFHLRQYLDGTLFAVNGELKKVNLKTDNTISAGVYPAWHPEADIVAFSTNNTSQMFFTRQEAKVEVYDAESDLILYDIASNEVSAISNDADELESFPTWSPDGKTLYYVSAHFEYDDTKEKLNDVSARYEEIKYNIYSRTFDLKTRTFGEPQLVFDAVSMDKSATLPQVSPDGKYLTFALGSYGCFHVWHKDADICIIDLQDSCSVVDTKLLNSSESDSYPSFSSNGRWIMTASRRDDGNYTRPYIAYFDAQGKCHKAFEVPQKDPAHNPLLLRSYNRPEFLKQKVKVKPQDLTNKIQEPALQAKFKEKF